MIGGWNVGSGGGKTFIITFKTTPEDATITVRNEKKQIVQPTTEKTYKLKTGIYSYDVTAEGYFSKTDEKLSVLEDGEVDVKLDKKLYVTFILNPPTAELTVKDSGGQILKTQEDHTYEVKAGMYSYSCSAENYQSVENVAFEMRDTDETKIIDVKLIDASIYGVRRKLDVSTTAWERINNSQGKTAKAQTSASAVQNDFDNIAPWKDIRSCDISANGIVNAYIGDPSYDPKNPKGYIMTEVPEFWYKRLQTGGYEYIYISAVEQDGYTKSNKFYIGRYTATGSSSAVTCKSGAANLVSITLPNLRAAAKKIGTNWGQLDILHWSIIQMLYLVEYADYNSQKMLGYGVCSGSIINTGALDSLQMKSGCLANDKKSAVIYRGIENIFGNILQWCDGINFTDSQAWVCTDPTKYESDKLANPYTKLDWDYPTSNSYIKEVGYDANFSALQLVKTIGGSDSTYISDFSYHDSGLCVLRVGAGCNDNLACGLWYFGWYSSSLSDSNIGGRLLFTPA